MWNYTLVLFLKLKMYLEIWMAPKNSPPIQIIAFNHTCLLPKFCEQIGNFMTYKTQVPDKERFLLEC